MLKRVDPVGGGLQDRECGRLPASKFCMEDMTETQ